MPTNPEYLQTFSCFSHLPAENLKALAEITNALCYPAGYVLFQEGKPGERIFFLVKGEVEVMYQIGEDGPAKVDTVSGEEVVGCSALVEPYTYAATERSRTEVEVLEMDAHALRELMQKDCRMGFLLQQQMIKVLMQRILNLRLAAAA